MSDNPPSIALMIATIEAVADRVHAAAAESGRIADGNAVFELNEAAYHLKRANHQLTPLRAAMSAANAKKKKQVALF